MKPILIVKNLTKKFKEQDVLNNLSFEVIEGEFFSLLGPSGVGKTTLLRIIAGLDRPNSGEIFIDGKLVCGANTFTGPEQRKIGLVFQEPSLFPHLTVFENVAFGLKGLKEQDKRKRVYELLSLVGLENKAKRFPSELSGGEYQRVSLARALAPYPKLLLLDEPFANLDKSLREELREEVKRIAKIKGMTTILVTHDQEEAFTLSDRIGILGPEGKLEQIGSPQEIYLKPQTLFVARFVGKANFLEGSVLGGKFYSALGVLNSADLSTLEGQKVIMIIRPEDLIFCHDEKGEGVIREIRFQGSDVLVTIETNGGLRFIAHSRIRDFPYRVGDRVKLLLDRSYGTFLPVNE